MAELHTTLEQARAREAQARAEVFRLEALDDLSRTRGVYYLPVNEERTRYAAALDGDLTGYVEPRTAGTTCLPCTAYTLDGAEAGRFPTVRAGAAALARAAR